MTGAMLFATIIELSVVVLLIIGFINEDKVIEFEDKIILLLAKAIKRHIRRRYLKKKAAQKKHLELVSAQKRQANKIA